MKQRADALERAGIVLGAAAALVALLLLALALAPSAGLDALADRLAPDGDAQRVVAGDLAWLQARALLAAVGWLALAGLLVAAPARAALAGALHGLPALGRELHGRLCVLAREEPLHALALLCLTGLTLSLGLHGLDEPVRTDEAATWLNYVARGWLHPLVLYTTNNHVLYSLLARGCCSVVTEAPLCLRLPAMLAAVALVPLAYFALRSHFGARVALLAVAVLAPSTYLADFATNGRSYTLLAAIFMLLLALAPRLPYARSGAAWLVFVAASVAGLWTVPVMLYPFAIVLCWLAWTGRALSGRARRRFYRRLAVAALASGMGALALYTPALIGTGLGAMVYENPVLLESNVEPLSFFDRLGTFLRQVWKDWSQGLIAPLAWFLLVGAALGAALPRDRRRGADRLFVAVVIGAAFVLALTRAIPPTWITLFLLPVYLGLGFAGWARLARWLPTPTLGPRAGRALLLAAAATLASLGTVGTLRIEPDARRWYNGYVEAPRAAEWLRGELHPGDRIAARGLMMSPILFHLEQAGIADPWSWTQSRDREGVVYAVLDDDRDSALLLERLERDGFAVAETVRAFEGSRIVRLHAQGERQ